MLKRWRMFPSCTSCILKITWHTSLSPHAHALQQPQVCLDDDQILHLCRFSIVKDCQKIRSEWASTLSLSFKSWEESWLALNLCYTIPGQTLNYFSIQSNLDKMTAMSLMMMTSKITLPTTAIATRYSTRYSNFLLLLDSNSTRSQKPLLAGACLGVVVVIKVLPCVVYNGLCLAARQRGV